MHQELGIPLGLHYGRKNPLGENKNKIKMAYEQFLL
jgi:hypothetical protein